MSLNPSSTNLRFLIVLAAAFLLLNFTSSSTTYLSNPVNPPNKLTEVLNTVLKNGLHCSHHIFYYNTPQSQSTNSWKYNIDLISSSLGSYEKNNGISISKVAIDSIFEISKKYTQPEKIQYSNRCAFVLVCTNIDVFSPEEEQALERSMILPFIKPPTIRNRDKYIFLAESSSVLSIHQSKLIKLLKHSIFIEIMQPQTNGRRGLLHLFDMYKVFVKLPYKYLPDNGGKIDNLITIDIASLEESSESCKLLFPDHEKNFSGHKLVLSTTTKVPQLLEMSIVKVNGKDVYYPKRGLYAFVLHELSIKLNFTYEIVPSSGGGSTGHALLNGTWVGIVGDTYRGEVDFGFMAAITYQRFPFAELCAPINFAYIGFVTGPPRKKYAWNAILWPFNIVMWVGVMLSTAVATLVVSLVHNISIKFQHASSFAMSSTTFIESAGMLLRVLLEQSNIPKSFFNSYRLFIAFWLIFCLVCSAAYTCKMVSLLTFPIYDPVPSSFDELARATDFDVDFHYFGNVGYAYFKTSTNPSFVTIYKKMGREPDPLKCLQRALDGKVACIIFILTFQELLFRNLSDQFGNSPLKFTAHEGAMFPAGVIHQYGAPLSSNFKSVLNPAMETGLIPYWQQEDLNQVLDNKNEWQKANNIDGYVAIWGKEIYENDNLLRVRNLTGAFIVVGIGLTAAIFAFVFENIRKLFGHYISAWFTMKLR